LKNKINIGHSSVELEKVFWRVRTLGGSCMSHFTLSDISKAIRIISKVKKTQHQNPKFGHTQGEIKKNLQKSTLAFNVGWNSENHQFWSYTGWDFKKPAKLYISIQWGMKLRKPSILVGNWVSSGLSFFLSASTVATYIFTAPDCTIL
jgi:hypothetical protein